ncbi:hypothetical protein EGW08_013327 [Elysia chlorotica]|uniref:Uncharacterized protein n=1 Tax=Elysia chlorotica TaxID=188477 RepID=A0A3S1B3C8_ELYCH|nr:hypothetical protein EGW08_013327 [Elysia chlorotica]
MGFMAFSTTVLGWLPGPMIYGALVDTCCEIWNSEGACSLYNLSDFRFRFHLLIMICRGVSMALFVGVFLFVSFSKTFEFNSHTDDDEEAKATLPSDKQPDQNGKYQYHSINQPFKMRSKIGGSPQP